MRLGAGRVGQPLPRLAGILFFHRRGGGGQARLPQAVAGAFVVRVQAEYRFQGLRRLFGRLRHAGQPHPRRLIRRIVIHALRQQLPRLRLVPGERGANAFFQQSSHGGSRHAQPYGKRIRVSAALLTEVRIIGDDRVKNSAIAAKMERKVAFVKWERRAFAPSDDDTEARKESRPFITFSSTPTRLRRAQENCGVKRNR